SGDFQACIDVSEGCVKWEISQEGVPNSCWGKTGPPDSPPEWNVECESSPPGSAYDHCVIANVNCARRAHCAWSLDEEECYAGLLVEPEAWYKTPKATLPSCIPSM